MRFVILLLCLLICDPGITQIINPGFDDWVLVQLGQPFEDPAGWDTNNDNLPIGLANTPVKKGGDATNYYARISSSYWGIDALLPGRLSQTIAADNLRKIDFRIKCDSIFQSGSCVINLWGDDQEELLYTDSISAEDPAFYTRSLMVDSEWASHNDSITLQFVAKGNLDSYDELEDGYSIFLVDDVAADYISASGKEIETISMDIYPNPSKGLIYILHHHSKEPTGIEIFSMRGQSILKTRYSKTLQLDALQSGVYLIQILLDKTRCNQLLVIEK